MINHIPIKQVWLEKNVVVAFFAIVKQKQKQKQKAMAMFLPSPYAL